MLNDNTHDHDVQEKSVTPRLLIALGLALTAAVETYIGTPVWPGLAVWFVLAIGIGLELARWWALLLTAIPYPVGIGVGLMTGRYAFLGEAWEAVAIMTVVIGLTGIVIGILLARLAGIPLRVRKGPAQ